MMIIEKRNASFLDVDFSLWLLSFDNITEELALFNWELEVYLLFSM